MNRGELTTILSRSDGATARLCLVVVGQNTFATYPLPDEGEVTIGRSDKNDIRIDDPSVSREHAVLHISEALEVEDLGGANGTSVRKEPVTPGAKVSVEPDQIIGLGTTMVIVQRTSNARPRRLWTHDYFEGRVEEECVRAASIGGTFGVLRIHLDRAEETARHLQEVLSEELSSLDIVAAYGPGEFELLLMEASREKVDDVCQRLEAALQQRDVGIRIGRAHYPENGRTPEALVARACEAVKPTISTIGATERPRIVVDDAMVELYRMVDRIAAGNISVMLLGETGVGKEILAEAVHDRSPRSAKRFVRLNCAALSETLLESELFGHEKGAFTGATNEKLGLLEAANGGTVFLDEAGELPMSLQVKLLRVLEAREVLRVGAIDPRPIDVRFVSATNRDLEVEVIEGRFRADLFFRLNGIALTIPPLRERKSEIKPLAKAFVQQLAIEAGLSSLPLLSPEAVELLEAYSWPGNIRELRNVIERALLLTSDDLIRPEHLPVEKMRATLLAPDWNGPRPGTGRPLDQTGEESERQRILSALERCGGNQTQAAKLLGISRRTLVSRLDKYDLPRPRKNLQKS